MKACVSLRGRLFLAVAPILLGSVALPLPVSAQGAAGVGSDFELTFWQSVADSDDRAQFQAYLTQYPNGTFSALARAKIGAIDRREGRAAPAATVPVAAAPAPVPAAPIAAAPAYAAPVAPAPSAGFPAPAAPAAIPTGDHLRALSDAQRGSPAASAAAATADAATALPPRPQLAPLSDPVLPDHFCSAVERNNYYDSALVPAKDAAERNNQTAIAHMQRLRQIYDQLAQTNNAAAMNAVAGEAREYQSVASDAYARSAAFEGLFNRMMAVPIGKCS